jgi:hypothetical protein
MVGLGLSSLQLFFTHRFSNPIPSLCSLVPRQGKVLTMLRDKVQRCPITLMMKMQTAKSILKGVSWKHQLPKNYVSTCIFMSGPRFLELH